ncbi:hypothetical protein VNO77_29694 [Canavalia gladiata]|uniref:Uncharacterized protein n=1 Tax=Canavalia gladiata TaxID=3824 RepID=A0AAN9KMQ6_CANGL
MIIAEAASTLAQHTATSVGTDPNLGPGPRCKYDEEFFSMDREETREQEKTASDRRYRQTALQVKTESQNLQINMPMNQSKWNELYS